jgi:hypothetical protein
MDPDHDQPPWVPQPRAGGGEPGGGWFPLVPAPRVAPDLERMPGRVATLDAPAERSAGSTAPSTELVPVPRRSDAVAVRDAGVPGLLRAWGRTVARLVHAAVDGVRSLLDALVPAPASR